jgi:cytoskeletal protein CcmA (bactofilin family)
MTPHLPHFRSRFALLGVLLVLFAATVPAIAAAETRAGGTVIVGPDETIDGLEAFGGDVTVLGTVDGDLSGFAGSVTIAGNVTGSVDVAAGSLHVEGTVGGDVEAGAGSVTIARDGVVAGNLDVGAGAVSIDGTVLGNARIGADLITLGPTAHLAGNLDYDGDLRGRDAARIDGAVTQDPDLEVGGFLSSTPLAGVGDALFSAYFFLVNLLMGALLLLLFPRFTAGLTSDSRDRPGRTSLAGIVAFLGVPVGLVVVGLTIVGLPFSLLGVAGYVLALWIGAVYGRLVVGAWLLDLVDREGRWLALVVGLLVIELVRRVPVLGGLAELFVLVLGLGGLALALVRTSRRRRDRESPDQTSLGDYPAAGDPDAVAD